MSHLAVAALAGFAAGGALFCYLSGASRPPASPEPRRPLLTAELEAEFWSRNISFLGAEPFHRVRAATVVIVGLGGVGSHAAHMLARSGVGRLRLIDFDNVTLSSLNRAALATLEDVGTSKVEAMRRRLAAIVPSCEVEAVQELFRGSRAAELLAGADYVVDCIDNVDSKVELLAYCHGAGVRVLSSMGAALKADPSKLRVCDLSETLVDPLSRVVRQKLARLGVDRGITVVYSVERPRGELLPLSKEQEENPDEFRALEDVRMRVRVLPVLGTEPALFGNALAAVVLLALAGHDLQMDPPLTGRTKVYERIHAKAVASGVPLPRFDSRTMERLVEHTWRGKCARTGTMLSLTLVPWDPARDPDWDNLVLLNTQEAKRHQRIGLQGADPEWVKAGERALAEFRAWMRQRREDSEEASTA